MNKGNDPNIIAQTVADNDACIHAMLTFSLGNANVDMVWIVHGWKNSGQTGWLGRMKDNYFASYNAGNVKLIVAIVDWGYGASLTQGIHNREEESFKVKLGFKACTQIVGKVLLYKIGLNFAQKQKLARYFKFQTTLKFIIYPFNLGTRNKKKMYILNANFHLSRNVECCLMLSKIYHHHPVVAFRSSAGGRGQGFMDMRP